MSFNSRIIRRKIRYGLIYWLARFLLVLARWIPRKAWLRFFGFIGGLAYHFSGKSRTLTLRHLAMIYGSKYPQKEIKKMAKGVFRMLGRNGSEVLRTAHVSTQEELNEFRIINGFENFEAAHKLGKGILLLTAHIGAFEFVATELATRGYKPMIIGAPLKDPRLNELLWKERIKTGAVAVERGKETIRIIRNLNAGGSVIILIDQDTRVKSRFVNFMGLPASTPIGATVLAMRTGAAVVPMFIHLRDDLLQEFNIYPAIPIEVTGDTEKDLVTNTQRMSDVCEKEILKYPTQWVWMHERWKTGAGEEVR